MIRINRVGEIVSSINSEFRNLRLIWTFTTVLTLALLTGCGPQSNGGGAESGQTQSVGRVQTNPDFVSAQVTEVKKNSATGECFAIFSKSLFDQSDLIPVNCEPTGIMLARIRDAGGYVEVSDKEIADKHLGHLCVPSDQFMNPDTIQRDHDFWQIVAEGGSVKC